MQNLIKSMVAIFPRLQKISDRLDRTLDALSVDRSRDTETVMKMVMSVVSFKRQIVDLSDIYEGIERSMSAREFAVLKSKVKGIPEETIGLSLGICRTTVRNYYKLALYKSESAVKKLEKYGLSLSSCRRLLERFGNLEPDESVKDNVG